MITTININDKWKLEYDGESYMPVKLSQPKDKTKPLKWTHCYKYFKSPEHSIRYMVGRDMAELGEVSIQEFIDKYLEQFNTMHSYIRGE